MEEEVKGDGRMLTFAMHLLVTLHVTLVISLVPTYGTFHRLLK